jgi:hypothetical protein
VKGLPHLRVFHILLDIIQTHKLLLGHFLDYLVAISAKLVFFSLYQGMSSLLRLPRICRSLSAVIIVLLCIVLSCYTSEADGTEGETSTSATKFASAGNTPGVSTKSNRKAIKQWARGLTDLDFNSTHWSLTMRKQPQNFFYHYAKRLTQVFNEYEDATINFVLVGACDGTNDDTIRDHYLPNKNWQGLFVEPVSNNYRDLGDFLAVNHAMDRSYTVNAAITDVCETKNVSFKVSAREEKDPNAAHWLRRQIGSIAKENEKFNPENWRLETVRCATPLEVMTEWSAHVAMAKISETELKRKRQRVHVLKIDAEGHDYKVGC